MAMQLVQLISFEEKLKVYEEQTHRSLDPTEVARIHRETMHDYYIKN